ncbi:VOC family protein [Limosilactobacillus kribbianus]|uniref:VOC family protein n=1 Tax=Limosilactobacillus kribbianus TaxID=2982695 RepID=UPI002264D4C4|nr:VOC family protein [Limosilactobacillus kribbianus]
MKMRRIDHVVLTVSDLEESMRFYHEVFDMPVIEQQTTTDVITLRCGHQLIRLQKADRDTALKAPHPTSGAADLCLVAGDQFDDILHHLRSYYVDVVEGPIPKYGSEGEMTSIYVHDPDQNLIEIAVYKNK